MSIVSSISKCFAPFLFLSFSVLFCESDMNEHEINNRIMGNLTEGTWNWTRLHLVSNNYFNHKVLLIGHDEILCAQLRGRHVHVYVYKMIGRKKIKDIYQL